MLVAVDPTAPLAHYLLGAWVLLAKHATRFWQKATRSSSGVATPSTAVLLCPALTPPAHVTRRVSTQTHVWRKAPRCSCLACVARLRQLLLSLCSSAIELLVAHDPLKGLQTLDHLQHLKQRPSPRHPPSHFRFYVAGSQILISLAGGRLCCHPTPIHWALPSSLVGCFGDCSDYIHHTLSQ